MCTPLCMRPGSTGLGAWQHSTYFVSCGKEGVLQVHSKGMLCMLGSYKLVHEGVETVEFVEGCH